MSAITLKLMGAPSIELDGEPIHISRRKAFALLAYLAVTQQSFSRDVLATMLWPESSQHKARSYLRRAIYSINNALNPCRPISRGEQISLSNAYGFDCDVIRFRRLLSQLDASASSDAHLTDEAIQAITEAADLYRGDFMTRAYDSVAPGLLCHSGPQQNKG